MSPLIVTGATGGLGTEVVRSLVQEYPCVALYRNEKSFAALRESLGDGVRLAGVQADLADPASVRNAVQSIAKEHGSPYGLVHLAGGFAAGSLAETSDETWSRMLELNLTAAFVAIRETLAVMDRASDGRVIVISSEASLTKPKATLAYAVSKSALNVLVEVVAKDLRGSNITANALLPSSLDTPETRKAMPNEQLVPLEQVAAAIRFLLSPSAAKINGALIPLTAR